MIDNATSFQQKIPPYKSIGWTSAVTVMLGVLYVTQFAEGRFPDFLLGLLLVCSFVTLLMFALEIYRLYQLYQEGQLFPMRNLTFFTVCLSFVALPLLGVYGFVTGFTLGAANSLLVPVFLWLMVNNLFYVRLDSVGLETKNGFFNNKYIPRYEITGVEETEGNLVVSQAEGPAIRLFRAFFFEAHWATLRNRLQQ